MKVLAESFSCWKVLGGEINLEGVDKTGHWSRMGQTTFQTPGLFPPGL